MSSCTKDLFKRAVVLVFLNYSLLIKIEAGEYALIIELRTKLLSNIGSPLLDVMTCLTWWLRIIFLSQKWLSSDPHQRRWWMEGLQDNRQSLWIIHALWLINGPSTFMRIMFRCSVHSLIISLCPILLIFLFIVSQMKTIDAGQSSAWRIRLSTALYKWAES